MEPSITDLELLKKQLAELNARMGEMEQKQGAASVEFFTALLSDQLIFRRANGKIVGKTGPDSFLDSLQKASPFTSRRSEDISTTLLGDRALVTLIVVATRLDGSVGRYRNIRLFFRTVDKWVLECWYNYDITGL